VTFLLAATLAAPAFAQQPSSGDHVAHHADALADGEVRKVDKDAKKLTIKHGPIPNLEMPAMTMVFQVKDAQMLEQVKPGDKVRFEAQKLGGAFTVTRIEAAK
jgi:Cu/Ag efflux protein CusF